jgi:hypothetical protein
MCLKEDDRLRLVTNTGQKKEPRQGGGGEKDWTYPSRLSGRDWVRQEMSKVVFSKEDPGP